MKQASSPSTKAQAGGKRLAGTLLAGIGGLIAGFGVAGLIYLISTGAANGEDGRYMVAVVLISAVPIALGAILFAIGKVIG